MASKNKYAKIQLAAFISSCISILLYWNKFLSTARATDFESFLLVVRALNEMLSGHFDIFDALHHVCTLIGLFLLSTSQLFRPHAWLGIHMQILHFPMTIWYFGCRKDCAFPHLRRLCKEPFRVAWLAAISYRASVLFVTAIVQCMGAYDGHILVASTCLGFNAVFCVLDVYWTRCFFSSQGQLRFSALDLFTIATGFLVGMHVPHFYD